ncbi:hypothetical protein EXD82_04895 [Peptacetobacter hominis]|uniref:Uncharacterized protein n=1 Tax=Peptacetobacter hominis TaxID=2743610 RepID=A0A544QVM0_9FIRM|nr:hypothetical protein [Peptacetobacter hominis]TQQ84742.1 hypothetical protein EXD82_04895 [Peptacetobacter hominis]
MGKISLMTQISNGKQIEKLIFGNDLSKSTLYSGYYTDFNYINNDFKSEKKIREYSDNINENSIFQANKDVYVINTITESLNPYFKIIVFGENSKVEDKKIFIKDNVENYLNLLKLMVYEDRIYALYADKSMKKITAIQFDIYNSTYKISSQSEISEANFIEGGNNSTFTDGENIYISTYNINDASIGIIVYNINRSVFSEINSLEDFNYEDDFSFTYQVVLSRVKGNDIELVVKKGTEDLYLYRYDKRKKLKLLEVHKLDFLARNLSSDDREISYSGSENYAFYGNKIFYVESYKTIYGSEISDSYTFSFDGSYDDKSTLKVYDIDKQKVVYEATFRASGIQSPIFIKE